MAAKKTQMMFHATIIQETEKDAVTFKNDQKGPIYECALMRDEMLKTIKIVRRIWVSSKRGANSCAMLI